MIEEQENADLKSGATNWIRLMLFGRRNAAKHFGACRHPP
jgi:hypothetical protein